MKIYHTTDIKFREIDLHREPRNGHHANGAMGLWCFSELPKNSKFGPLTLEIKLQKNTKCFHMDIDDWWKFCLEKDGNMVGPPRYRYFRERLLLKGVELFQVLELDGEAHTVCLLTKRPIIATKWL